MSIQWHLFDTSIEMTPAGIVNELKRITNVPEHCSIGEFLSIYLQERNTSPEAWRKALLEFCVAVWALKAYKGNDQGRVQLQTTSQEMWNTFCDRLDELPDTFENHIIP